MPALKFFGGEAPGYHADVVPVELIQWNRTDGPIAAPSGVPGTGWDCHGIYCPVVVRNLDRTVYRDSSGNLVVFYIGNDDFSGNDFDQSGFYKGPDLNLLVKISVAAPFVPLGASGDPDSTDAQVTSVWWDGTQFVIFYNGNQGTGSDDVNICLATSPDLVTLAKQGVIVEHGSAGDAYSAYTARLVPSDANGNARLYYFGRTAGGTFGLMGAVSTAGISGPYTKLSPNQLFSDGETDIGDVWWDADKGLYVMTYSPLPATGADPGVCVAFSRDGLNWTKWDWILGVRASPAWDVRAYNAQFVEDIGGESFLVYNSNEDVGFGYSNS